MRVKAARLAAHGQPLTMEEVELPEPGPGETILEVAYAGVNPVDMYGALGRVAPDGPLPRTLGGEGAGTVGGRRVLVRGHGLGATRDGLWAQAAVVPEAALTDVPDGVGLAAAAAMGIAGVTAWRTVTELAAAGPGDTVVVLGASGGVGSIIVSLAHGLGATVIGQTGNAGKRDWIAAQGADHVVVCGADELAGQVGGYGPTVVFDALGDGFTGAAVEALRPRGRLVLFGTSAGLTGELPLQQLYRKGLRVYGYGGLIEPNEALAAALRAALGALARGELSVPIDSVLPLADVNTAFERLSGRSARGNLVLDPSS
ncbi:MAG TPA: zinc-binding alcohol dehydrogenase family protein [Streptosporangiaceae bacterium]|jgi:NADPH2:quinone reductase